MKSYIIKKKNKNNEIVYMEYSLPGYNFSPKKNVLYMNVKNVKIVDSNLTDIILSAKFDDYFNKLVKMAREYLNSDEDNGNSGIVLGEIDMIRGILQNKYQKFLAKEKELLFLKKLRIIEQEIKAKELYFKRT